MFNKSVTGDRGPYFRTISGIEFYPFDPRPEEITIEDIAHSLAMQCRFGGHVVRHYSIAEHSLRGSYYCRTPELALRFLMHDATEAYCVDLPRPLKRKGLFGYLYRRIEKRIERAICERFALEGLSEPIIKLIDARMLETEKRDLRRVRGVPDSVFPPFTDNITNPQVTPQQACDLFLRRFNTLREIKSEVIN